jgi:D-glycero-D-manno-heptose 1,7-bisphosphate phosphatase
MAPTQCVILVGGLGTRLGALTAQLPKPCLLVGGRPFLDYLVDAAERFGFTDILLLAGYQVTAVEHWAAQRRTNRATRVKISAEPTPRGTAGALRFAAPLLDDVFLLLNGDSWFDFNWLDLVAMSLGTENIVTMALRQVDDTSRYGVVESHDGVVTSIAEKGSGDVPGTINGGVYLVRKAIVDHLPNFGSLERDVLPQLAAESMIFARVFERRFIDIGVPNDFERAQTAIPQWGRRPAAFLDRDGVLIKDFGHVHKVADVVLVQGAVAAVKHLNDSGHYVFVVTNQAGVAKGYYPEVEVHRLHKWLNESFRGFGAHIDEFRYCPHHPEGLVDNYHRICDCRKPSPGMILDLMSRWDVDASSSFLIGDQTSDIRAAEAAGIPGFLFRTGVLDAFVDGVLSRAIEAGAR